MGYDTYKLCGLALVAALSVFLLKNIKRELEMPLALIGSMILLGAAFVMISPILEYISSLFSENEIALDAAGMLLRVIGIAMISKISADICREMGAAGVAASLETVAKFEIIILSLPLVTSVLDTVKELFAEAGL